MEVEEDWPAGTFSQKESRGGIGRPLKRVTDTPTDDSRWFSRNAVMQGANPCRDFGEPLP